MPYFLSVAVEHCLFINLVAGYVMMLRCLCYRPSEIQSVIQDGLAKVKPTYIFDSNI